MSSGNSHVLMRGFAPIIALWLTLGPAVASEPRWPQGDYKYISIDQNLADALKEFGRNSGIPVKISSEIKGRLSGAIPIGSAKEFLDRICDRHGLIWHFDGAALNVSAQSEVKTEFLRPDVGTASDAIEKLTRLHVIEDRFPTAGSDVDNLVTVSGPPSYVATVAKVIGARTDAQAPMKATAVRVFRGRQVETQNVSASPQVDEGKR